MHKIPKLVLSLGGILFALGLIVVMVGGLMMDLETPPSSEDWSGTLMFKGDTPATFEGEFKWIAGYNIFVQDGANVTIEVVNSDVDNIFESCEVDDGCDLYDVDGHINGYHYIGYLDFEEEGAGTYEIRFTEENGEAVNVMIREDNSFGAFLVSAGGVIGCFAGIILLIIGGILTKVMKGRSKVEITQTINDDSDKGIESSN